MPGPVYRPGASEVNDVPEPPEDTEKPVYSPEAGWIEPSSLTSRWYACTLRVGLF